MQHGLGGEMIPRSRGQADYTRLVRCVRAGATDPLRKFMPLLPGNYLKETRVSGSRHRLNWR